MAVILVFLANQGDGGVDNPHLSTDMDGFTAGLWSIQNYDLENSFKSPITSNLAVTQTPNVIQSISATSYYDDYYNRIHVSPVSFAMGNILSTQTEQVWVWNAYVEAKTLDEITGLEEGMLLEGQPAPPLIYQPMQELTYEISVTQEGPLSVDAVLKWDFDGETPGVGITATRVTIWGFVPDWEDGITERLEWLTEILASESLVEQRRCKRLTPRRVLEATMYIENRERQLLDLITFAWSSRIWVIPIWPDIQLLDSPVSAGSQRIDCNTDNLDFYVGGTAILRGETAFEYEGVEIASVDSAGIDLARPTQNSWLSGTRLYPGRTAQLLREPERVRLTDTAESIDVQFLLMEPSDWPESLPTYQYQGFSVLELTPDESEDLIRSQVRLISTLDNRDALPQFYDLAGVALRTMNWRWMDLGRQARSEFRSLIYGLRGRQVPVFVPTHSDDLTIVAPVTSASTIIDVAWCGLSRFGQAMPGRRDIRILLMDETIVYCRITGVTELSSTVERLSLESAVGVDIAISDVCRVCWMQLCRGNSDSIEIIHETDSEGVATSSITFREVRDDAI